jgi:hypothetical protein
MVQHHPDPYAVLNVVVTRQSCPLDMLAEAGCDPVASSERADYGSPVRRAQSDNSRPASTVTGQPCSSTTPFSEPVISADTDDDNIEPSSVAFRRSQQQLLMVMRIAAMVKHLHHEAHTDPLDAASRNHLRDFHARTTSALADHLTPELRDELQRLVLPFIADSTPSDVELRIALAQLVGWLEGVFAATNPMSLPDYGRSARTPIGRRACSCQLS